MDPCTVCVVDHIIAAWWYTQSYQEQTGSFVTENIIIINTYTVWSFKIKYFYVQQISS